MLNSSGCKYRAKNVPSTLDVLPQAACVVGLVLPFPKFQHAR